MTSLWYSLGRNAPSVKSNPFVEELRIWTGSHDCSFCWNLYSMYSDVHDVVSQLFILSESLFMPFGKCAVVYVYARLVN